MPDRATSERAPWAGRRLHFVGMGGAGMSGLALVAHALGAQVSGSDRAPDSPYTRPLRALGIVPAAGHDAAHVPDAAELVVSTAIGPDNPERTAGRERGLRELHRAELLGEITRLRPTLAVTGTHGKTTTASMAVHALRACGMDPGYLVGGEVRSTGANAGWGAGEWLVVEADESDRSLLALSPRIAVLTNAELDHHTTYASQQEVDDTFAAFLAMAEVAVLGDEPGLGKLAAGRPAVTARAEDVVLGPDGSTFTVTAVPAGQGPPTSGEAVTAGSPLLGRGVPVTLSLPGEHNARNAATALVACQLAGADLEQAAAALAGFTGAGRRFERLGHTPAGALVVDDYAHHPTEVRATIAAARTLGPRRVVAAFQPHLYSRTEHQAAEFGAALAGADVAAVLDVYPARERAEDHPGVTGRLVADAAHAAGAASVAWTPGFAEAEALLREEAGEGDVVLTMGAGDITALGRRLVA